jgi:hypothetical protein
VIELNSNDGKFILNKLVVGLAVVANTAGQIHLPPLTLRQPLAVGQSLSQTLSSLSGLPS